MVDRLIEFWPKRAVLSHVNAGTTHYLYTQPRDTGDFSEAIVKASCAARTASSANFHIDIYAQISNDGVEWEELSPRLARISWPTFPQSHMEKYTDIGKWMRFEIRLLESGGGLAGIAGGTIAIKGMCRSELED